MLRSCRLPIPPMALCWPRQVAAILSSESGESGPGRLVRLIKGHRAEVSSVVFSPDGRVLATVGNDGTARLWNVGTGQERLRLTAQADWLTDAAFSPDGSTLMARASSGGTIQSWNLVDLFGGRDDPPATWHSKRAARSRWVVEGRYSPRYRYRRRRWLRS